MNESMHSEMGPVRQNPIQRTVRTAHLSVLMTAQFQYTIQHRTVLTISPNLPSYPETTIISQLLSIGGKGARVYVKLSWWEWKRVYTDILLHRILWGKLGPWHRRVSRGHSDSESSVHRRPSSQPSHRSQARLWWRSLHTIRRVKMSWQQCNITNT